MTYVIPNFWSEINFNSDYIVYNIYHLWHITLKIPHWTICLRELTFHYQGLTSSLYCNSPALNYRSHRAYIAIASHWTICLNWAYITVALHWIALHWQIVSESIYCNNLALSYRYLSQRAYIALALYWSICLSNSPTLNYLSQRPHIAINLHWTNNHTLNIAIASYWTIGRGEITLLKPRIELSV